MNRRAETIQRTQAALAELRSKHSLTLGGSHDETFLEKAKRLGLPRDVLSKTVIPCQVELEGSGRANPCLIVPQSLPVEMFPAHKRLALGGQVESLTLSEFTMPKHLLAAAWRPVGTWQGGPMPILVSIQGEYKFLVRSNSLFFRSGRYTGSDLDATSPMVPEELGLKRGRYEWGDDMSNELTIVVAEF
ncbi:MAG TPA: hypothetical protein VHZ07_17550 [Bryobacteraceae bacterium]|jgi:hypothetical protein|nr:hypothetical protein [Bryobacteraceae bacterium]